MSTISTISTISRIISRDVETLDTGHCVACVRAMMLPKKQMETSLYIPKQ